MKICFSFGGIDQSGLQQPESLIMPAFAIPAARKSVRSRFPPSASLLARSPSVGHGHAADHFVAGGAQRFDASAEGGAGGHYVIDEDHSALTGSISSRERVGNVLDATATTAFGLLLGMAQATQSPRVDWAARHARKFSRQQSRLIVAALGET